MKRIIHVNQHVIKANRKNNTKNPPLTCKSYKDNIYANDIIVKGPCRIRYSPDKPLPCGAHVWIETTSDVTFEKEFKTMTDIITMGEMNSKNEKDVKNEKGL